MVRSSKLLILLIIPTAVAWSTPRLSCKNSSWYDRGRNDGTQGHSLRVQLRKYQATCQKTFKTSAKKYYTEGWNRGVRSYCARAHGYELGRHGKLYNNVCPHDMMVAFNHAWQYGIDRYCTPENAFSLGKKGAAFPGFCPPWANVHFYRAYRRGKTIFKQIKQLKAQATTLKNEIQKMKQDADSPRLQTKLQHTKTALNQLNEKISRLTR